MQQTHPFDPIADERSKVLILGSFPSLKSFENNFYYSHPRNQFWPIMETLFDVTLTDKEERRAFLLEQGIALWDVYAALKRKDGNSSDSNLTDLVPNDIPGLLQHCPNIRTVFCTGRKSFDGLKKAFPEIGLPVKLLPSPSPAYAAMRFEEKVKTFQAVRDALV